MLGSWQTLENEFWPDYTQWMRQVSGGDLVGKTDQADFHLVFTADGLRWTRTIRRMPVPYDAETLSNVRSWPWSISYGQIRVKQAALMAKVPSTPLPPLLAPVREEEPAERREARLGAQGRVAEGVGVQRQAGPVDDEAASDRSSTSNGATSSKSFTAAQRVDDNMVLEDLVKSVQEDNRYDGGVDISPKRGGEPGVEEVHKARAKL